MVNTSSNRDQLQQDAALQNLSLEHKDEFSLNLNLAVNTHSSAANPFLEMTEVARPSLDLAKQEPYGKKNFTIMVLFSV